MKKYLLLVGVISVITSGCSTIAEEYMCKGVYGGGYWISPSDSPQTYCTRQLGPKRSTWSKSALKYYNELYADCLKEFSDAKKSYKTGNCEKINITQTKKNGVKCTRRVWSGGQSEVCDDGSIKGSGSVEL